MKVVPVSGNGQAPQQAESGVETPLPASLQSGEAQEQMTDEQAFNMGLMG